jgi:uncharacterized membrane protein
MRHWWRQLLRQEDLYIALGPARTSDRQSANSLQYYVALAQCRMELKTVSLYVMAAFYVGAGLAHFAMPKFFLRIMPPYIPWHRPIVYLSGVAEIGLGVLLVLPQYTTWAAWGIIALLVAVFPANLYHYTSGGAGMRVPQWALVLRLPLQLVLMGWAYLHTR